MENRIYDISNSIITKYKIQYNYYNNRNANNYNFIVYERNEEANTYEPRILVSHIEYRTNYYNDYNYGNVQEKSEVVLIVKGRAYTLLLEEFKEQYLDLFLAGKLTNISKGLLNFLSGQAFQSNLLSYLYLSANKIKTTNCWTLINTDCHLKFDHTNSICFTPKTKIKVTEDILIANKNINKNHTFYEIFNFEDVTQDDIDYCRKYFELLYKAVKPEARHEYLNLIMSHCIGSLFKWEMKNKKFGEVNFPILLITGPKRVGKTFIISSMLNMFYRNDSDYKKTESDLSGSSPLTRIDLNNNSVCPYFFDEITNLNSLKKLINHYLVDGCFKDTIGQQFGKGLNTRYFFNTPILASNAIELDQYGSDAVTDRFVNYNLNIVPIINEDMYQINDDLLHYDKQRVGKVIFYVINKHYSEIIKKVNDKLRLNHKEIYSGMTDIRTMNKLKYLIICHYVMECLSETEELKDVFTGNTILFYKELISNKLGERVITRNNTMIDAVFKSLNNCVKENGNNHYLSSIFNNDMYKAYYDTTNFEMNINEVYDTINRLLLYYTAELGLVPTTEYGYFIVTKQFLKNLSSIINDKTISKKDFEEVFGSYLKLNTSGGYRVGTADALYIQYDQKEDVYNIEVKKYSDVIKFNLLKFYKDNVTSD